MRVRPRVTPTVLPDTDTTTNTSGKGGVRARNSECNQVLGSEATPLSLFKDPCDRAPRFIFSNRVTSILVSSVSAPDHCIYSLITLLAPCHCPACGQQLPCSLCLGCVQQVFQEAASTASTPHLITLLVALFYALLCHLI